MDGVSKDIFLARAADPEMHDRGQDGGLVSAILLWCLENDRIDAALVSLLEGDGSTWKAVPGLARTREEILAAAGSRYTYSANTLAYMEAVESGAERLALVGMSCQASIPGVMRARKAGKVGRRLGLSIGLLCSKTFDDAIFDELFEAKYGLARADIVKMNIKGVFQIWMRDGAYHEIPLKECHQLDPGGVQDLPRLRGRARRHRDRWDRRLQRLDPDAGPHRRRARDHRRDDRGQGASRPDPATTIPAPSPCCASCRSCPAGAGRRRRWRRRASASRRRRPRPDPGWPDPGWPGRPVA